MRRQTVMRYQFGENDIRAFGAPGQLLGLMEGVQRQVQPDMFSIEPNWIRDVHMPEEIYAMKRYWYFRERSGVEMDHILSSKPVRVGHHNLSLGVDFEGKYSESGSLMMTYGFDTQSIGDNNPEFQEVSDVFLRAFNLVSAKSVGYASCLIPVRVVDGELEVFMTRRAMFNQEKNCPMNFPGEWGFGGGKQEPKDNGSFEVTAVREFREEMKYGGSIYALDYLRSGLAKNQDEAIFFHNYTAFVDEEMLSRSNGNGETADTSWLKPGKAIDMILSERMTDTQRSQIHLRGFLDERIVARSLKRRRLPIEVIKSLDKIRSDKFLVARYEHRNP